MSTALHWEREKEGMVLARNKMKEDQNTPRNPILVDSSKTQHGRRWVISSKLEIVGFCYLFSLTV